MNASNETPTVIVDDIVEGLDFMADWHLNESFVNNQLLEWQKEGELGNVLDEFRAFWDEDIKD